MNALTFLANEPLVIEQSWLDAILRASAEGEPQAFIQAKDDDALEGVTKKGNVALMPISGPIFPKASYYARYFGYAVSASHVLHNLRALEKDDAISDIIMAYNTPGGAVTMTHTVANEIRRIAQDKENGTKITAYVIGSAASAGYWYASQSNEIVMDVTARVGSIGVVASIPKDDDYYHIITNDSSPNKRPNLDTKEGKQTIKDELNDLALIFQQDVAAGRGVSLKTVQEEFGRGAMMVGQRAVDLGMADRLGTLEELISSKLNTSKHTASAHTATTNKVEDDVKDLDELKAKYPDIYKAAMDAGKAEASAQPTGNPVVEAENAALKTKLEAMAAVNQEASERLKALEAKDAQREAEAKEAAIKADAGKIVSDILSASAVPAKFHPKVTAPDTSAHTTDGAFDAEGFKTAFASVVKDWEDTCAGMAPIQGPGAVTTPAKPDEATNAEANATADRMASYLGLVADKA